MLRKSVIGGLCMSVIGGLCMTALLLAATSDTPVADAAMRGDRDSVRSLLKQGVDVNAGQGDGMTALHWAAFKDDVEMAQMLIYAGANVKAATRINAMTPLFMASKNGSASMIETLLKAGADANSTMTTGTTPLMLAAASGSADAVKVLLDHGADVNAKEAAHGQTALMFAAAFNRDAAIKVLMQHGADATVATNVVSLPAPAADADGGGGRRGQRPGTTAATLGQGAAAAAPAANAAAGGGQGQQGGAAAAAKGQGVEEELRNNLREVNINSLTPLDALKLLADLQKKAAAAAPAANAAGGGGQGQQGQNQGDGRASRPETLGGLTALLFAARQGHIEAARVLLEAGADVNEVSPGDKTRPLLMAIINGHYDLAKFLLDHGADPNLANTAGGTPLYATVNVQWAPEAGYPQPDTTRENVTYLDLMKALLERGADPNAKLKKELWFTSYTFDLSRIEATGATPFWRAAQAADVDAMRLLVAAGADPNIPSEEGVTPLGVATGAGVHGNDEVTAPGGRMPAVKYLVEELGAGVKGAGPKVWGTLCWQCDVNAADSKGYTPLHNAASIGDNEMVLYLVEKGARVDAVSKAGETTADMANGPRQRIQPFPETIALLVKLGSKFNNKCVSC